MEAFFTASKAVRKKPGHSGFRFRSSRFLRPFASLTASVQWPLRALRPPCPKISLKQKSSKGSLRASFSDYAIISNYRSSAPLHEWKLFDSSLTRLVHTSLRSVCMSGNYLLVAHATCASLKYLIVMNLSEKSEQCAGFYRTYRKNN